MIRRVGGIIARSRVEIVVAGLLGSVWIVASNLCRLRLRIWSWKSVYRRLVLGRLVPVSDAYVPVRFDIPLVTLVRLLRARGVVLSWGTVRVSLLLASLLSSRLVSNSDDLAGC